MSVSHIQSYRPQPRWNVCRFPPLGTHSLFQPLTPSSPPPLLFCNPAAPPTSHHPGAFAKMHQLRNRDFVWRIVCRVRSPTIFLLAPPLLRKGFRKVKFVSEDVLRKKRGHSEETEVVEKDCHVMFRSVGRLERK